MGLFIYYVAAANNQWSLKKITKDDEKRLRVIRKDTKLHEWREYLQQCFLGFKGMRSMRTSRQKRRRFCHTIFGAEFGSAAAECGPIRKKLWRQPSSFKQYFQTKLCTKKMWQNLLRFCRDMKMMNDEPAWKAWGCESCLPSLPLLTEEYKNNSWTISFKPGWFWNEIWF